jgi:hypothetical protein
MHRLIIWVKRRSGGARGIPKREMGKGMACPNVMGETWQWGDARSARENILSPRTDFFCEKMREKFVR